MKIIVRAITIVIAFQLCELKFQNQGNKSNATIHAVHTPLTKQNFTLGDKATPAEQAMQSKRTTSKHHEGNRTITNKTSNATSRQLNMESFIENHKGAIVRLLKKLLLPKLKARALQPHLFEKHLETDPSNKNLDKEAMNYELGYFLGLQKAFKNRQMLMGDSGEDNLVPLKLVHHGGSSAAVTDNDPMTGFTSVALPFHKLKARPIHESLGTTLQHYGMQDPGFLKKITKADERDILQFAGKNNMDVFAERNNLRGIGDYLAKRNFISRPSKATATNEGAAQRIKKDDILGTDVLAEELDGPKEQEPTATVEEGPNPLENVPTPLHQIISQAHHISANELHGLLRKPGDERINMKEVYNLIEAEEKAKEIQQDQDKTPQIGSVFGEDTNVQAENGFRDVPGQQGITSEELENVDKVQSESEVEKRTLKGLLSIVRKNEDEEEKKELRQVLRKIIDKLSEIPDYKEKFNNVPYELPHYQNHHAISRTYIPYYYNPFYQTVPVRRLWRRNVIQRPKQYKIQRRTELPRSYAVKRQSLKSSDGKNDYIFEAENRRPPDLEETGGVEAYALPKIEENPRERLENFISTPKEESLGEAIELLNRGSSIDDSLGDHLQSGFLQQFVLPNSPSTLYKRNMLKLPRNYVRKPRTRRSNDVKTNVKSPRKKNIPKKSKKRHGKKKTYQPEANNDKKTIRTETSLEVTNVGSKKHEILRDPTVSVLSGIDSYVSPPVFESRSQNFFTQGPHDGSHLINQLGTSTVLLSGPNSGIGTAPSKAKIHNQHEGLDGNQAYQARSRYLEQFIANPRMSAFRSSSYPIGRPRSGLVGNRHVSPALEIYSDNSVSSAGDLPVMEVQKMLPNGVVQDQTGSEQLIQQVAQGTQDATQGRAAAAPNEAETEGQGSVEIGSKYEVVKSSGDGNLQPMNNDLLTQQTNQVMEDTKGDEQTGANALAVEEISGETKQAISNTLAALDKQSAADLKLPGGTMFGHSSSSNALPMYDQRIAAHPLSDHNMVQTLNQASKGLDEELFMGPSANHLFESKVPNHVYLPDEDFDGIDWKKIHQPVHGPLGYDARDKDDIQLLSNPFFAPGVGEPIGDHSKPPVVPPLRVGNPLNTLLKNSNGQRPQVNVATPSVTDAKAAPAAILTADAVNTLKAITSDGAIKAMPGANVASSVNALANTANTPANNFNASTSLTPAAALSTKQQAVSLMSNAEQQIRAHEQAVHEMHKEIAANADKAAAQMGTAIANTAQNATKAIFAADVKNAAQAKVKDNNLHAAQFHQLANAISTQNTKVAAKANEYLNNAGASIAQEIHSPVSAFVHNDTIDQGVPANTILHSLEGPYSKAIQMLEDEANKAAYMQHDALHAGAYINQDAIHSLNGNSASNLLSHDHIDANLRTPAIFGDWHSVAHHITHHHEAYPYHWNHVELESQPQVVDMTPMTPGGIHFMAAGNSLSTESEADATNAAKAIAAVSNATAANAANANAANAANAAAVNAANANAATVNAANANAANANVAAGNPLGNSADVNSTSAAANNNAAQTVNAAIAAAAAGLKQAATAALAAPQKSAGNEFTGRQDASSNIGSTGGMMNQGNNIAKAAGSAKTTTATKDKISDNVLKDGYPDINNADNDKRIVTNNEESFDNDTSKKADHKETQKAQTDESSGDESSGIDASTSSTANAEENGAISFDTAGNDDFKMDEGGCKQESKLDGKAQMEFNQINDDDGSGAGTGKTTGASFHEEPSIESDDSTTSLQLGNVKDSKVQEFASNATTSNERDDNFVMEPDKTTSKEGQMDEQGEENTVSSGTSKNGESRPGSKKSQWHKAKDEAIQSDEALKGNRLTHKSRLKMKHNKHNVHYKQTKQPLQKKLKVSRKHSAGNKWLHKPVMKSKVKNHLLKMKGHSVKGFSKLKDMRKRLNSSTEFFIGKGSGSNTFMKPTGKSSEFKFPNILTGHVKDDSPKHRNSSEFFIIKTNNLTTDEPMSEESLYTTNSSNNEFITGEKKTIVDDLADFKLSDSAKKHLLPGDLEKLAKLHRMLSMAQINMLRKEEMKEVKGMVRMLKSKASGRRKFGNVLKSQDDHVKGQYRSAINEALKEIEGVKKSLTNQEDEQENGKQPKNERYRAAIHEALKEVEAVKKSLMQSSSSSTRLLTNALAISNLANLLRESTNIFNKAYTTISKNNPSVAANMVTGDLISPGTSGVLINPAATTSSQKSQQIPDTGQKLTKDIYAEIGSPALVEEQTPDKKSLKGRVIDTHITGKHPGLRTIKETKRQTIRKN